VVEAANSVRSGRGLTLSAVDLVIENIITHRPPSGTRPSGPADVYSILKLRGNT
jgi:hypothetical protein